MGRKERKGYEMRWETSKVVFFRHLRSDDRDKEKKKKRDMNWVINQKSYVRAWKNVEMF